MRRDSTRLTDNLITCKVQKHAVGSVSKGVQGGMTGSGQWATGSGQGSLVPGAQVLPLLQHWLQGALATPGHQSSTGPYRR